MRDKINFLSEYEDAQFMPSPNYHMWSKLIKKRSICEMLICWEPRINFTTHYLFENMETRYLVLDVLRNALCKPVIKRRQQVGQTKIIKGFTSRHFIEIIRY